MAESPGCYNPVVLVGPTGTGKTHLLEAIASHLLDTGLVRSCRPMQARDVGFPRSVLRFEVAVLVDDIDGLGVRDQERLLSVLSQLVYEPRQVVVTAHDLDRVPGLQDLASSSEWGLMVQLLPNLEARQIGSGRVGS